MKKTFALTVSIAAMLAFAQDALKFEVASVKLSAKQTGGGGGFKSKEKGPPGPCARPAEGGIEGFLAAQRAPTRRLCVEKRTLLTLIHEAYGLPACPGNNCDRVQGGPDWVRTLQFDIDARVPADAPTFTMGNFRETPHVQQRLQSLLAERFALQVHRESRESSVYALTVAKGGHKLKQAEPESQRSMGLGGRPDGDSWNMGGRNLPMQAFADFLSDTRVAGRPVVDRTGLQGGFDFSMVFANDNGPGTSPAPSIFKAIEDSLGLKLESTRAPLEFLIIDRAQQPTEN